MVLCCEAIYRVFPWRNFGWRVEENKLIYVAVIVKFSVFLPYFFIYKYRDRIYDPCRKHVFFCWDLSFMGTNSLTSARHGDALEYIRIWATPLRKIVFWDGVSVPYKLYQSHAPTLVVCRGVVRSPGQKRPRCEDELIGELFEGRIVGIYANK